jgi:hypothetical protein
MRILMMSEVEVEHFDPADEIKVSWRERRCRCQSSAQTLSPLQSSPRARCATITALLRPLGKRIQLVDDRSSTT